MMIVWSKDEGGTDGVYAKVHQPGIGWSSSIPIASGVQRASPPEAAMDGRDNRAVVWISAQRPNDSVWARLYN
jgi:hypothetical protein